MPGLSQFNNKRRAHTLERRSIDLKIRPLVLQTSGMMQELLPFFITKRNIPSVRSQAKASEKFSKCF
jgi:hypothetical protein